MRNYNTDQIIMIGIWLELDSYSILYHAHEVWNLTFDKSLE